ncbi:UdgX family uracil-DNA binding protein [Azoarcus olearius]|uniref:Type-4 uracil-DNA glycosylase n=1 Tax=Azoarcus sp. (strain BH72) TaxID=418699 RepID=A1K7R1_AZOSB|nr:UdgX family uracil-DNA binding protein [Azoarcus olearius]CAL94866.1 putative DNA polymerase related protein [Azoarcus olearius]
MPPAQPKPTAAPFVQPDATLAELRAAAGACTGCDLYRDATQTVFGEGPDDAPVMLVGEQPGDAEDRQGHPFVGPAGKLLDRALTDAGIDRSRSYVTNAVKHFKWIFTRGHKRLHQTPRTVEVQACAPWLEAEIARVKPQVLILLGATAAKSLLGSGFRVTAQRGVPQPSPLAPRVVATIHPSALLRMANAEQRERAYAAFVADLRAAVADPPRAPP